MVTVRLSTVSECDINFERIGCYQDSYQIHRPLPDYILTDREKGLKVYSGRWVEWKNWDQYLPNVACRCAKKAKEKGYNTFGLQYYGKKW